MLIPLLVLFILFLIVGLKQDIKDVYQNNDGITKGGNGRIYALGRPSEDDTMHDSIERLRYLSTYKLRNSPWKRGLIYTSVISILFTLMFYNNPLQAKDLILMFIFIFAGYYAVSNFYIFHLDYFPMYYSLKNLDNIQKFSPAKGVKEKIYMSDISTIPTYEEMLSRLSI